MPRDKEKDRQKARAYRAKNPEKVRAALIKYRETHRDERNEYSRRWRQAHPLETDRNNRNARIAVKAAAFNAYGGALCACCKETRSEFLSIDHVNGHGNEHRRQIMGNKIGGGQLYYWLKKHNYPLGFRVLCFNCNFALGHFGYCPHGNVRRE